MGMDWCTSSPPALYNLNNSYEMNNTSSKKENGMENLQLLKFQLCRTSLPYTSCKQYAQGQGIEITV